MSGKRILIVRCGAVGDTVLATCVIDPLLAHWPDARLEWLATPVAAGLFAHDSRIQQCHLLKHRRLPLWLSGIKRSLLRSSHHEPFHLILNLETAVWFRPMLHRLCADRLIGYGDGGEWLQRHGVENHRSLLAAAGIDASDATPRLIPGPLPAGLPPRYVVIHPGNSHASARRPNLRAWPVDRWMALASQLLALGMTPIISGTAAELPLAATVAGDRLLNLAGKTRLDEMLALLQHADLLISSDTGPVHLAAAVGCPVVGLYGPTLPVQTAPFATADRFRLLRHPLPCSPCYATPRQRQCRDNLCMQAITIDEVIAAACALQRPPPE
jgi:ADP-heptose:LPS heptosyltransferase